MNTMKKFLTSLLLSLFILGNVSGFINAKGGWFVDNFQGKKISNKWDIVAGGSNAYVDKGILTLSEEGMEYYPYLISKDVVFPTDKSFVFQVEFASPELIGAGGEISAMYFDEQLIPHNILNIRRNTETIEVNLWNMGSTIPLDAKFHTYSFEWDLENDTVSSFVDGNWLMTRNLPGATPTNIEIGHRPPRMGTGWVDMKIDSFTIKPLK